MKRRSLLVLFVIMTGAALATADDVYVPNSTVSGGGNTIPFGGQRPSSSNPNGEFTYQWWIPAASLGGKSGPITDLAVLPRQTGIHTALKCKIAMSHNTLTRPSSTFAQNLPNPVTVFPEGPWSFSVTKNAWCPFNLNTSGFVYNGRENLTIQIRFFGSKASVQGSVSYVDCWDQSITGAATRIYKYGTGTYTATSGSVTTQLGLKIRLTINAATLTGTTPTRPGDTVNLGLKSPQDAGLPYLVGTSLGTGPIPIDTRKLYLTPDDLLVITVNGYLPMIFKRYAGFLSATGQGVADIAIPNDPALVGVDLNSAFITLKASAPSGIQSISNTHSFIIHN